MYTILAIDDDPGARTLLEIMLTRSGFSVILAEDADVAFEKINQAVPDLIISDISLPGMDGIEFVESLRQTELGKTVPVVILSAHHDNLTINKAIKAGATEFIKKPLMMNGLAEHFKKLIEENS